MSGGGGILSCMKANVGEMGWQDLCFLVLAGGVEQWQA